MTAETFFDLVKRALPEDMRPEELTRLVPRKWWLENPRMASACALRKCSRINWEAYRERNVDVKQAGIDPCLHFIRDGIYEGRRLLSWHKLKEADRPGAPLVSLVIINFNNAHLLDKTIGSALSQSLKDIEIIIVDDCSTDESLEIIKGYAAGDERIRVIVNERNSASMIARKRGAEAAVGRYVMFLDSDDYLAPNACEAAFNAIIKGYDMVKVGAHVVNSQNAPEKLVKDFYMSCNGGDDKEYFYDEIIRVIFHERKMSWQIWGYICLRELVQAAYAEFPEAYFTGPDDLLATMAVARRARNLLKIPDKLFFYNFGPGITVTSDKRKILKYMPAVCGATRFVRQYAERHCVDVDLERLYEDLCDEVARRLIPVAEEREVGLSFGKYADMLGFEHILKTFIHRHADEQAQIASLARSLVPEPRKIKHIGIFYHVLGHGGVEVIIRSLCDVFKPGDYKITVFTEERADYDLEFPPHVRIARISPGWSDHVKLPERMRSLEREVLASGIDVMLHASTYMPYVVWDLLLLRQHGVFVIFFYHFNSALAYMQKSDRERQREEAAFRAADAVTCLSVAEELYLRRRGANAIYMPNPVYQFPYRERDAAPPRIAVLGRFGAPIKQTGECLKVLRQVISRAPHVSMVLIGDFYTDEQRDEYKKKIKELGLERNIRLTGWTDNPNHYLRQCGVLLSVSLWEAFPMNIAEALALGLPCVIYDLAIEQARDNRGVIAVPQKDYAGAAREILDLLENPDKWRELSRMAVEDSRQYAPEHFASRMRSLLDNFQRQMPHRVYAPEHYETLNKCAAFYSGRKYPQTWQG